MRTSHAHLRAVLHLFLLLLPLSAATTLADKPSSEPETCVAGKEPPPDAASQFLQLKAQRHAVTAKNLVSPVLNELLPRATSGTAEWIELFNPSACPVDLSDWSMRDAAGNSLGSLRGVSLNPRGRAVVAFSAKLNNGGDTATLFNAAGLAVDTFTYTSAQAGRSYGRVPDGGAWSVSGLQPSPGEANCPEGAPHRVVINEVFPAGPDGEWVELFNGGCDTSTAGWEVADAVGAKGSWTGTSLPAGGYTLVRFEGRLNNAGDTVTLKDADGVLLDIHTYGRSSSAKSWARLPDGGPWADEQGEPTPGSSNGDGCPGAIEEETPAPTPAPGVSGSPTGCGGTCGDGICFGSFNIQNFGAAKAGRPAVLAAIQRVLARYDVVAVQELSQMPRAPHVCGPHTEAAICASRPDPAVYEVAASPRIGDEQYVVMFRKDVASLVTGHTYPDPQSVHSRPPHAFELAMKKGSLSKLVVATTHTSPHQAEEEINNFPAVTSWIETTFGVPEIVLAGDYNADGSYFSDERNWPDDTLPNWPGYTLLTSNSLDTTVAGNDHTYDRVVVSSALAQHAGTATAYHLENLDLTDVYKEGCEMGYVPASLCSLHLTGPWESYPATVKRDVAREVSDHHPVEVCAGAVGVPSAVVGLDVNNDGRPDYLVAGVDANRDGIPDALQMGGGAVFGGSVRAPAAVSTMVMPQAVPQPQMVYGTMPAAAYTSVAPAVAVSEPVAAASYTTVAPRASVAVAPPQVSTVAIREVPQVQLVEKIVEVPQVQVQEKFVDVPTTLYQEKVVEVPQVQVAEVVKQVPRIEVQEVEKRVAKPVTEVYERVVEVPQLMTMEKLFEVPQVQVVETVRQVARPQVQEVQKAVAKPTFEVRERVVEVPHVTYQEQLVEVPKVEYVEMLKEVPRPEVQTVQKQVEKPVIQAVERVVEVPQTTIEECIVEIPQVEIQEVVKQVPRFDTQWVDKQVKKKEIQYIEKIVEVPQVIYEERIVEVPQIEYREVIKQVPKPEIQYVDKRVPKHVIEYVEKIVEVPQVVWEERAVEVPQVHNVEAITQVPKPQMQTVQKQVPKIELRAQERIVEVPTVLNVEQAVEVPQMLVAECVTQVPRPEIQYIDREVPLVRTEVREQVVEVPQVMYEERLVEVPQVQVAEFVKQVPVQQYQEVPKEIPKVETRAVEKVVPVPTTLIHEVAVEVPQVCVQEVLTQVPSAMAEQRIVQTGIEYERNVRREQVVAGIGEARFSGVYEAPVVRVDEPVPSRVMGTITNVGTTATVGPTYATTTVQERGVVQGGDLFSALDRNHDGVISRSEFQQGLGGSMAGAVVSEPMAAGVTTYGAPGAAPMFGGGQAVQSVVTGGYATQSPGYMSTVVREPAAFAAQTTTIPGGMVGGSMAVPGAVVGLDVNNDGRPDYLVAGMDLNRDGIPDALQMGTIPGYR